MKLEGTVIVGHVEHARCLRSGTGSCPGAQRAIEKAAATRDTLRYDELLQPTMNADVVPFSHSFHACLALKLHRPECSFLEQSSGIEALPDESA